MQNSYYVGIDLGGTNIKVAVVDGRGRLKGRGQSIPTPVRRGKAVLIDQMLKLADKAIVSARVRRSQVRGVGIGCPGPLSAHRGIVLSPANLRCLWGVPLRDIVAQRTGLPVVLENDGNATAFGEYWCREPRCRGDLVVLTLGTGIGGGIVLGGNLLRGTFENAGELGHIIVFPDGPPCSCGQQGCLEACASGTSIVQQASALIECNRDGLLAKMASREPLTAALVVKAATRGDPMATIIWDQACRCLATAIVAIQHTVNVRYVVLAGGMAAAGDEVLKPVRRYLKKATWKLARDMPQVSISARGCAAGAVGAAACAISAALGTTPRRMGGPSNG